MLFLALIVGFLIGLLLKEWKIPLPSLDCVITLLIGLLVIQLGLSIGEVTEELIGGVPALITQAVLLSLAGMGGSILLASLFTSSLHTHDE